MPKTPDLMVMVLSPGATYGYWRQLRVNADCAAYFLRRYRAIGTRLSRKMELDLQQRFKLFDLYMWNDERLRYVIIPQKEYWDRYHNRSMTKCYPYRAHTESRIKPKVSRRRAVKA